MLKYPQLLSGRTWWEQAAWLQHRCFNHHTSRQECCEIQKEDCTWTNVHISVCPWLVIYTCPQNIFLPSQDNIRSCRKQRKQQQKHKLFWSPFPPINIIFKILIFKYFCWWWFQKLLPNHFYKHLFCVSNSSSISLTLNLTIFSPILPS